MIALTIALAAFVGIALGLLAGGGAILTVPLLAYVAGLDPRQAITISLLVVGVTAAVSAITHARAGRVQWRTAALFGSAAMAGAYAGGLLARLIPGTTLMIAFAVVMIAAAIAMLRGRKNPAAATARSMPCSSWRCSELESEWLVVWSAPAAASYWFPPWRCWAD